MFTRERRWVSRSWSGKKKTTACPEVLSCTRCVVRWPGSSCVHVLPLLTNHNQVKYHPVIRCFWHCRTTVLHNDTGPVFQLHGVEGIHRLGKMDCYDPFWHLFSSVSLFFFFNELERMAPQMSSSSIAACLGCVSAWWFLQPNVKDFFFFRISIYVLLYFPLTTLDLYIPLLLLKTGFYFVKLLVTHIWNFFLVNLF